MRARRRVDIPVLVVYEGGDAEWRESLRRLHGEAPSRGRRWLRLPTLRDAQLWPIVVLMLAYLVGSGVLAVTVDRGFALNDAFAVVLFGVVLAWLWLDERRWRRRGRSS